MVAHVVLFRLNPGTTEETIEHMLRQTRMQLLKIPEVLSVRCGRRITPDAEWDFFLITEFESMSRIETYMRHPVHVKYVEEIIKPNTCARMAIDYEMEPGRDIRYS